MSDYFIVLAQSAFVWWPVALTVALLIFFAWWNDRYTKDKF